MLIRLPWTRYARPEQASAADDRSGGQMPAFDIQSTTEATWSPDRAAALSMTLLWTYRSKMVKFVFRDGAARHEGWYGVLHAALDPYPSIRAARLPVAKTMLRRFEDGDNS